MKRFILLFFIPFALFAETNIQKIVVSARGYAAPISKTPGGISVVENRAIFEEQPISVPNLGKNCSGVWKNSDGAWGSDINIRGLSRDSVVVLIDGARVESANAINARLGLIDPSTIERVEILKGPVSALYGSGSIGGVVNIITKEKKFQPLEKSGFGFSNVWKSNPDGFAISGWGSWANSNNYLYAAQTFRDFDSYKDGNGDTMQNSQFRDRQTTVKTGHRINEAHTLEAQVQYYEGENIGVPAGGSQLPAGGQWVTYPVTRRGLIDLTHTWLPNIGNWEESEFKVYYHFNDRRAVIDHFPAGLKEIRAGADHNTLGGRWKNRFQIGDHTLVAGADIWRRTYKGYREKEFLSGTVVADKPLPDSSFLSVGGFAEDSWAVSDRLTLNFGARADWIEVHNDKTVSTVSWDETTENDVSWSAHLGATYALSENLSAKGIVARGYRAATLEERFSNINLAGGGTLFGDTSLDPEESLFTEWSLDWESERLSASVSAFYNKLNNMIIVEDIGAGPDRHYANVSKAEIFGIETEADWRFSNHWKLFGNLSYLNGRDKGTGDDLPNIAPLGGLLGLRGEYPNGLWGTLETEFAAKQDQTPSGTDEAGAWQVVNLRLGYDFETARAKHTVTLGVENLFDEQYNNYLSTDRSGSIVLHEPGRSFSAAWKTEF